MNFTVRLHFLRKRQFRLIGTSVLHDVVIHDIAAADIGNSGISFSEVQLFICSDGIDVTFVNRKNNTVVTVFFSKIHYKGKGSGGDMLMSEVLQNIEFG